jgi:hypothetical protein
LSEKDRLGDPRDALLRALRNRLPERVRTGGLREQSEVVPARPTPGNLERVTLQPRPRIERLVVGQLRPTGDERLRLLLHDGKLGPLVLRRVPRQHHAADALVVVAVADHRDTAAAGVLQLVEKVDLLDRLAELLLVSRHLVEELRIRNDDESPLLRRDADRVDVTEPAVIVQLRVVVVEDVEVREPLASWHQPPDGIRDLERSRPLRKGGQLPLGLRNRNVDGFPRRSKHR